MFVAKILDRQVVKGILHSVQIGVGVFLKINSWVKSLRLVNLISSALLLKAKYFIVSTVVPVSRSFSSSLKFSRCDF